MTESILIVDDDKICNFITLNAFKKAGLKNVFVAVNGDDALKKLKEAEKFPDLILLDINMPVMNGFEFLENYQKEGFEGQSKIVMYTSSIRESEKKYSLQFKDVCDFVNKPISREQIEAFIQ